MMRPAISEEPLDRILPDHQNYPDSIEIGKAGSRLKVYFNANNLQEALRRVDEALLVREYAVNGLLNQVEQDIAARAKK